MCYIYIYIYIYIYVLICIYKRLYVTEILYKCYKNVIQTLDMYIQTFEITLIIF